MSTIMLVDDSATILLSISSILSKAGYKVEKAPNAEEALKKFNNGTPVDLNAVTPFTPDGLKAYILAHA